MQTKRPSIIAFASPKGGVGKSTSCINIAGALCAAGHDVHIIDLDQTQTLGRWFANHREALATKVPNLSVVTHPEAQILEHLQEAFYARSGFILVDVAGALGQAMLHAATIADLTITPSKLSEPDIMEAYKLHTRMVALGEEVEKPILHRILVNEVAALLPGYQVHALEQIANNDLQRFETLIHNRAAYAEVMFSGEPPHFADRNRPPIRKAIEEIDALVREVFAILNNNQQVEAAAA